MPTAGELRLEQAHQRDLATIGAGVMSGVANIALGADPAAVSTWFFTALDAIMARVSTGYAQARRSGTGYIQSRATMAGADVDLRAGSLSTAQARTSLEVTGPVAFKRAIAAGADDEEALLSMATQMSGSAQRLAIAGDRDVLEQTIAHGKGVIGYRRVLGGPGCGFCAMLASRGAVYLSRESASMTRSGLRFHDHCRCSVSPLFDHEPDPPDVQRLQRQWQRITAGQTGQGKAVAWRNYWENDLVDRSKLRLAASKAGPPSPVPPPPHPAPGVVVRSALDAKRTLSGLEMAWQAEAKRITGRDLAVSIPGGTSLQTAKEYAEGVLRGLERFPDATLARIRFGTMPADQYAEAGARDITFNQRWANMANRPRLLSGMQDDVAGWSQGRNGWGVRGSGTPTATAIHEFGHVIDIGNLSETIHSRALSLATRRAALEGIPVDDLIARDISVYATSDAHELIAEAFADVMLRGQAASPLSKDIFDLLEAEYFKAGGRITPAFGTFPAKAAPNLARMTVPQLRALAAERGVTLPAKALKADIVRALEEVEAAPAKVARTLDSLIPELQTATRRPLGEGAMADVQELTFADGSKAVLKEYSRPGADTIRGPLFSTNEELAAKVLHAVGVRAAEVRRISDSSILMDFIEGQQGGRTGILEAPARIKDSLEGRRLGLADAILGHRDRNGGNWMLAPDGGIVAIDNGGAFRFSERGAAGNPFTSFLMGSYEESPWKSRIALPEAIDLREIRRNIEALKSEFVRLGRQQDYRLMLDRLTEIERRAVRGPVLPELTRATARPLPTPVPADVKVRPGPSAMTSLPTREIGAARWLGKVDLTSMTAAEAERMGQLVQAKSRRDILDEIVQLRADGASNRALVNRIRGRAALPNTYDVAPQVDDVFRDELLAAVDNGTIDDVVRRHLAALDVKAAPTPKRPTFVAINRTLAVPEPGRLVQGRNLVTDSAEGARLSEQVVREAKATTGSRDMDLLVIARRQGFDGPPSVVSPEQMDALYQAGAPVMLRGVQGTAARSADQILEDLRSGPYTGSKTAYGSGYYFAPPKNRGSVFLRAEAFAKGPNGGMIRATIHPDARMVTFRQLQDEFDAYWKAQGIDPAVGISAYGRGPADLVLSDVGRFAAARGYDVIFDDVGRQWAVLNRTALIVEGPVPVPLAKRTVAELRTLAKERQITLPPKATKAQIVEELQKPPLTAAEKAAAERRAVREAARERNRQIEQATGTARLLAEVDELLAKKATAATIRQRLDPALIGPEQVFAGADPAVREALAVALASGDMAKVRAAVTRLSTKAKLKVVGGKAGVKVKFDPDTMESLGAEIADGAPVTVVTRGASVTLPDGTVVQVRKAQVVPAEPPKPVIRSRSAAKLKTIQDTMSDAEAKAEFAKAIDGEYVGGIRAEVTNAYTDGFDDQWTTVVEGNLFDSKTGAEIGQFSRQINRDGRKWEAHHDVLEIDRDHQGSGFANDFNANLYDWYRRSGIKKVTLGANIDVGGYAWATKGFDFEDVHELRKFISQIEIRASDLRGATRHTLVGGIQGWSDEKFAEEFPGWTQAQFIKQVPLFEDVARRVKAGETVSAYEISQLGRTRGQGRDDWWIGKALMFHSFWSGLMRL